MLVIRLQRTGRKNVPAYRIAVCEKSAPVKGRVKEFVGHYLPTRDPRVLEFDKERVEHWVKMGAQPSDTVARLLKREGVDNMDKFIEKYTKKKKRKEAKEEPKKTPKPVAKEESSSEEKVAEAEQPSEAAIPENKKAEAAIPEQKDDAADPEKEDNKKPAKESKEEPPKPEGDAEKKKE